LKTLKVQKTKLTKKYELIYINEKKELAFKILNEQEKSFFKSNTDKIKLIINDKDGRIYEFNNFKEYKEANEVNH
jgi:hypothetical protein